MSKKVECGTEQQEVPVSVYTINM